MCVYSHFFDSGRVRAHFTCIVRKLFGGKRGKNKFVSQTVHCSYNGVVYLGRSFLFLFILLFLLEERGGPQPLLLLLLLGTEGGVGVGGPAGVSFSL